MDDYKELIRETYSTLSADTQIPAKLFGSFTTEIGELDQAGIALLTKSISGNTNLTNSTKKLKN